MKYFSSTIQRFNIPVRTEGQTMQCKNRCLKISLGITSCEDVTFKKTKLSTRKYQTTDRRIKYDYRISILSNNLILHTRKFNLNRKGFSFPTNREYKNKFINSMVLESFKQWVQLATWKTFLEIFIIDHCNSHFHKVKEATVSCFHIIPTRIIPKHTKLLHL